MSENIMKRLKVLTKAQFLELPEIDANVRYFITDMPENQIDNADMALAITTEAALYNAGDIFICKDTDTYEKGHIYQLNNTKNAWEDITPASGSPTIIGTTDPTTSTVGEVGQFYLNTATGKLFICKSITSGTPDTYTWSEVGASGGSKNYMHSVKIVGVALNKHIEVYFNKLSRISTVATDLLSLQKLIGDDVLVASGYFVASIKINAGVTTVSSTCNLPVLTISKTTIAINHLIPADTSNLLISLPNDVMNLAVTDNVTIY